MEFTLHSNLVQFKLSARLQFENLVFHFTFQSGTIQAGEERNVIEMRYIDFTFQSGTIQAIDAYTI